MRRARLLVDYLVYLVVRMLICVVQAAPIACSVAATAGLAWLFNDLLRVRGTVVDENLRHAFPELSPGARRRLAWQMWRHLFLLVIEVAHAPRRIRHTTWRRYVRLSKVVPVMKLLMSGRPVIFVTGHFGNFELGGFVLGLLGYPSHSIARPLDNPFLDRFVQRFRQATGQYLIPKVGGYKQIAQVMAGNGLISFLADQAAGNKGCWIEFFGRPASAPKGIALLALEHQCPVVVVYCRRLSRPMQFELVADAILDPGQLSGQSDRVRELTQWYSSRLEAAIRQAPEQYWWLHRRWKDNRPEQCRSAWRTARREAA